MLKDYIHTIKILSRGLPKTGQEVSYVAKDDGEYEAGWWSGLLNETNRTRFVVKTINSDEVVIDLATGLTWARDGNKKGCITGHLCSWGVALDDCFDLVFAGFNDWRLPNINELASLVDWSTHSPAIYAIFTNTKVNFSYWSSTTRIFGTTYAKMISYSEGTILNGKKTDAYYIRAVRGGV